MGEGWMNLSLAFFRHRLGRGTRDDIRMHAVAFISLVIAFMCLVGSLWLLQNLVNVTERWQAPKNIVAYIQHARAIELDVRPELLAKQKEELRKLAGVHTVRWRSADAAVSDFQNLEPELWQSMDDADRALLHEVLPGAFELGLATHANSAAIGQSLKTLEGLQSVETFENKLSSARGMIHAVRFGVWVLSALVALCVFALIAGTVRLSLVHRKREIEVLRLCGATPAFVRKPIVIESMVQTLLACILGLGLILGGHMVVRGQIGQGFMQWTGTPLAFVSGWYLLALPLLAMILGSLASTWSVRRYLQI